jgi:hypothetical protein
VHDNTVQRGEFGLGHSRLSHRVDPPLQISVTKRSAPVNHCSSDQMTRPAISSVVDSAHTVGSAAESTRL